MKRLISFALLVSLASVVTAGCSDKATTKRTETVQGPGGTTQIEQKETVKKSGENPPNP
jgi:hypothetical protein